VQDIKELTPIVKQSLLRGEDSE